MTDKENYTFGYTDPRPMYGDPKVEWEPIRYNRRYDWSEAIATVGFGLGVSMTVAPMAWVDLFRWMLS